MASTSVGEGQPDCARRSVPLSRAVVAWAGVAQSAAQSAIAVGHLHIA